MVTYFHIFIKSPAHTVTQAKQKKINLHKNKKIDYLN